MMRKALTALALVVAIMISSASTEAAVSVIQTVNCGAGGVTTCSFGSAPTNGDEVVVFATSTCTLTVTDSNAVTVPLVVASSGGAVCDSSYAYAVTGSPTATYTFGASFVIGMAELRNIVVASLQSVGTAGSGTPKTTAAFGSPVGAGGIVLCGGVANSTLTITSSAGALAPIYANSNNGASYIIVPTAASSVTCTASSLTTQAAGTAIAWNAPPTYPGNGMVGDALFERLAIWN